MHGAAIFFSHREKKLSSLKPILRRFYTSLPTKLRFPVDLTRAGIQDTLENWRLPAYRVQATFPDNQVEGSMILFGDRPQYASWTYRMFGRVIEPKKIGDFTLLQILGAHSALKADISLCPINPLIQPIFLCLKWYEIPLYVNCHADLNKSIKALFCIKGANEDLRVARRSRYTFRIIRNDDHAIEVFFHKMMLPTINNRHEQRAFLSEWQNIKRIYQEGFLAAAYSEEQWVGAILVSLESETTTRLANMGWLNGDSYWLKNGIVAALINFTFNWAKNNNYKQVNLGASNPFANDGPLNFKLKWGATLSFPKTDYLAGRLQGTRSYLGVKLDLTSPATQSFLSSTPLLHSNRNKISVIGWNAEIPPLFRRQLDLGIEWINLAE
jgi:hypothetical protein